MKKILVILVATLTYVGCTSSEVVSDGTVRKALDIVYKEIQHRQEYRRPNEIDLFIKPCFKNQNYTSMQCSVLDFSDVEGQKYLKGCLLKNVIEISKDIKEFIDTPDVLVMAIPFSQNKDIVILTFAHNAKKTNTGFSSSPFLRGSIAVNLKTHKIGEL